MLGRGTPARSALRNADVARFPRLAEPRHFHSPQANQNEDLRMPRFRKPPHRNRGWPATGLAVEKTLAPIAPPVPSSPSSPTPPARVGEYSGRTAYDSETPPKTGVLWRRRSVGAPAISAPRRTYLAFIRILDYFLGGRGHVSTPSTRQSTEVPREIGSVQE